MCYPKSRAVRESPESPREFSRRTFLETHLCQPWIGNCSGYAAISMPSFASTRDSVQQNIDDVEART